MMLWVVRLMESIILTFTLSWIAVQRLIQIRQRLNLRRQFKGRYCFSTCGRISCSLSSECRVRCKNELVSSYIMAIYSLHLSSNNFWTERRTKYLNEIPKFWIYQNLSIFFDVSRLISVLWDRQHDNPRFLVQNNFFIFSMATTSSQRHSSWNLCRLSIFGFSFWLQKFNMSSVHTGFHVRKLIIHAICWFVEVITNQSTRVRLILTAKKYNEANDLDHRLATCCIMR